MFSCSGWYANHANIKNIHLTMIMCLEMSALSPLIYRGCRNQNVHILCDQKVDDIQRGRDGVNWEITTNIERVSETKWFESRMIINAAGAWSDSVAEMAGFQSIGIEPLRYNFVSFLLCILADVQSGDASSYSLRTLMRFKNLWICILPTASM